MSRLLDALRRLQHSPQAAQDEKITPRIAASIRKTVLGQAVVSPASSKSQVLFRVPDTGPVKSPTVTQPFDPEEMGKFAAEGVKRTLDIAPDPARLIDTVQSTLQQVSRELSPTITPQAKVPAPAPFVANAESIAEANATPVKIDETKASAQNVEVAPSPLKRRGPTPGERAVYSLLADSARSAAFRDLLKAVQQDTQGVKSPVVAIVGIDSRDQTAFVASVLATLIADELDRSVLLMETNGTGRHLSSIYGLTESTGLTEVLAGRAEQGKACAPTAHERLEVLPFGQASTMEAQLLPPALGSEVARQRTRYGAIVMDAGSLSSSWARSCSQSADAVYLVVQLGSTAAEYAAHCVDRFRAGGGKLTGCIALQGSSA